MTRKKQIDQFTIEAMKRQCLWCHKNVYGDKKMLTTNSTFNDQLDGPVEIPENASIRRAWLLAMELSPSTNIDKDHSFVCSKHFAKKDIFWKNWYKTWIFYGAVPSKSPRSKIIQIEDSLPSSSKISQKRKRKANKNENTKKKKTEQVEKFGEDGCEQILTTTSSWKHVPMEIMCDILKFNSRNEIEKFQWVSTKWNNIIKRNAPILPLRLVYLRTSGYKYPYPIISTKNNDDHGPNLPLDPIYIKSLETCIIKEVFFGSNGNFYDLEKEMSYLRKIPNILGHRAKIDLFNSYINSVNSCGDQIKYLKEIFEEIFEVKRVEFHIYHILYENILQNLSLIEEVDLPLQIEIKSLEWTKKFSYTSIASFINHNFQMFLNTEKPEAFIKEIKIDHPIDINPAINYMSSLRNVKFYHKDLKVKNGQTKKFDCYEVSREDNWSVEYAFYQCDYDESMVVYSVYKSEQQI